MLFLASRGCSSGNYSSENSWKAFKRSARRGTYRTHSSVSVAVFPGYTQWVVLGWFEWGSGSVFEGFSWQPSYAPVLRTTRVPQSRSVDTHTCLSQQEFVRELIWQKYTPHLIFIWATSLDRYCFRCLETDSTAVNEADIVFTPKNLSV